MALFLIFLFAISFFLISITTIPFVITCLVILTVFYKNPLLFLVAFISGIILDISLFRPPGETSLVLVLFLLLISLYGRKFEVRTVPFVFLSSFLGSFLYLWFFGYRMVFLQSLVNALLGVLIFGVMLNLFQHLKQTGS